MESRSLVKKLGIAADIVMYAVLLAQMLYVFLGNTLHEILGIVFFVCLVIHIVLKRKMLTAMWKGGQPPLRRLFSIVTCLLMLCIIALMLSSMGVSRLLFPWFRYLGSADLHRYLATAVLALSVLHGGLRGCIRSKRKKRAVILTVLGTAAAAAVGLFLVPYLNRHCKTVEIDRSAAVSGEQVSIPGSRPLVVYFTRVGNTDFAADVDAVSGASLMLADGQLTGNTELLAAMIGDAADCDIRAITLTGEKYPSSYSDTVSVGGKELRAQARPAIEPIDVSGNDTVLLVYPIWWGTVPMPVASFLEQNDFTGKSLYLIATQGSSGFADSTSDIRSMAPGASVTELVSIYCDDIPAARGMIADALKKVAADRAS